MGVHGVKKLTPPPLLTFNACLKYLLGLLPRTKNADPRLLGVKKQPPRLLASSFSSHLSHAGSLVAQYEGLEQLAKHCITGPADFLSLSAASFSNETILRLIRISLQSIH